MSSIKTRDRIVEVASELFYTQGVEVTSFLDLAKQLGISKGNLYHHFKTKNALLNAVIGHRLGQTQEMLDGWEGASLAPEDRIKRYLHIVIQNWGKIRFYGCPVGTLSSELVKRDPDSEDAHKVFSLFRDWLTRQFVDMGIKDQADEFAMRVLSWSQGVAILGSAFGDFDYVKKEVAQMNLWVDKCRVNRGSSDIKTLEE